MLSFIQLQELAGHAGRAQTNFYRAHYGSAPNIQTLHDWHALKPVTKDDLRNTPMRDRTFIPLTQLDHLRTSSGTSGGRPVFCPRTHVRGMDYRLEHHDFKRPFMAFSVPLMPHWHERFQMEHGRSPHVLTYDPANPAASARLAQSAGVDALSVFAFHIPVLGEHFKRAGINNQIRFVEITGEICSRALYDYMRATFPHARILQSYGASEVEDVHIGIPCRPLDGTEPLAIYHPKASHYLEIIDENGMVLEPRPGIEGDLLITAYPGEPSAFPLLRFRIGDTVRVVNASCAVHGVWSFTVLGRTELDFVKVPGGVLRADEAERVVRALGEKISGRFELHRFERETRDGPKPQVELRVEPLGAIDLESLAAEVARMLRVNPNRTYAEGVADGLYLPLTCTVLTETRAGKSKRIIAHP